MRRQKKESGASLDSLLDTMTNVVGILVILLSVTQLGVGEAVQKIAESDSVKPETYEQALADRNEAQQKRLDLEHDLAAYKPPEDELQRYELPILLKNIKGLEANLKNLLGNKTERELKELEQRKQQEEAQRRLDEQKQEAEQALADLASAEDALAKLKAKLADAPTGAGPGNTIITLPNPRAAPEGALAIPMIGRGGRVYFVDSHNLQQRALKKIATIGQRRNLIFNPDIGIDKNILLTDFNRGSDIEDEDFTLSMIAAGRVPRLVFTRREKGGETAEQLRSGRSKFERRIAQVNKTRYYARFLVWPDSFEGYIEARRICAERGLLAGWKPQPGTNQAEYTENLAANEVRFGPKPKPKPKPPTPPGQEPPKPVPPKRPPPPATDID